MSKIEKTNEQWRKKLGDERYAVLREGDTEPPWSGEYVRTNNMGTYCCAGCGNELFSSNTKFDAQCGWPSFWAALDDNRIQKVIDESSGSVRTEVRCSRCGGHLGHVFNDGPLQHGGKRFCINSLAIELDESKL